MPDPDFSQVAIYVRIKSPIFGPKCPDFIQDRPPSGAYVRIVDPGSRKLKSVRIHRSGFSKGRFCDFRPHTTYLAPTCVLVAVASKSETAEQHPIDSLLLTSQLGTLARAYSNLKALGPRYVFLDGWQHKHLRSYSWANTYQSANQYCGRLRRAPLGCSSRPAMTVKYQPFT